MKLSSPAIIVLILAVVIAAVFLVFMFTNDGGSNDNTSDSVSQTETSSQESTDNPEEQQPDDTKQSNPPSSVDVSQPPLVSTSSGHTEETAIGLDQTTQTICNTVPGAECVIEFTSSEKTVAFDSVIADSQGIATWDWRGSDVGSGTWDVYAKAGDQTSSKEVVYVQ